MLYVYTMTSGTYSVNVVLPKRAVNGATGYTKSPADQGTNPGWPAAAGKLLRNLVLGSRQSRTHEPHSVNQYLVNQFNDAVLQLDDHKGFKNLELYQIRKLTIIPLRRATLRERLQFLVLPFLDSVETRGQVGWRPQALTVPVRAAP